MRPRNIMLPFKAWQWAGVVNGPFPATAGFWRDYQAALVASWGSE